MRPYVKHIESNLKGGVDAELGYRTLIVGPNWSGKNAITQSVEYALSAKVSDVVGRALVADVNTLLTLGPGDSIFAEAMIPQGENLLATRCETKGKKSTTPAYPTAFPLRDVREALAGSVETVRKFFLRMVAGEVTLADLRARIPGPFLDMFENAIVGTPTATPAVDLLLHALARAKERERELVNEAKASASVVTETTQGVAAVTEADIVKARAALKATRDEVERLTLALERAKQIRRCTEAADTAAKLVANVQAVLAQIPAPAEADVVRDHLVSLLAYAEQKHLVTCPTCKQPASADGTSVRNFDELFWHERLALVKAKHDERRAQLASYTRLTTELANAQHAHQRAESALLAFSRPDDEPVPDEEMAPLYGDPDLIQASLMQAQADADQFEAEVIRVEKAGATWTQARRSRDLAAEREIQSQKWKNLADALKTVVGELLDTAVTAFVAKVQKFLPANKRFSLTLREEEREVCRYGFVRSAEEQGDMTGGAPDRLDVGLSGGEWALLNAALAAALVEGDPAETLRVVIPEDRGWDAHTLVQVLGALEAIPAQVIVATTTEPTRVPNGWTVIHTAAIEAAPTMPAEPAGDYIAITPCAHGTLQGNYCLACKRERVEKATAGPEVSEKAKVSEAGRRVPRRKKEDKTVEPKKAEVKKDEKAKSADALLLE